MRYFSIIFALGCFLSLAGVSLWCFSGEEAEKAAVEVESSQEITVDAHDAIKKVAEVDKEEKDEPLPVISIGEDSAPITVIQYTAFSCGHCAEFHKDVLPKIKESYVEPGYVKIVFRDYPIDHPSLRAAQVAWCGGPLRYLDMVSLLFDTQQDWLFADDPIAGLKYVVAKEGITEEQFESCLNDAELMDKIIRIRQEGKKKYEIEATPTSVINGRIIPYALTFEEFEGIVRPLLDKAPPENKT